jgi:hypothetical protein
MDGKNPSSKLKTVSCQKKKDEAEKKLEFD